MIDFANLYAALDASTRTTDKTDALVSYFLRVQPADAAWAVYFLTGNRPKQAVPSKRLQTWAAEVAEMPLWLFEESYETVGDLAETIALILPPPTMRRLEDVETLSTWMETCVLKLRQLDENAQRMMILDAWNRLDRRERFVFNKLITGGFRVGVASSLVVRALARVANAANAEIANAEAASGASEIDSKVISHRLAGLWQKDGKPTAAQYLALLHSETSGFDRSKPYPFFLAHPIEGSPDVLGQAADWHAEWKWDGIRGQLVKREGEVFLWSRGEELVTTQFPEIVHAAGAIEDAVLDGEILPMKDGVVMPFTALQKRLGRKTLGKKILGDYPVVFMAYDLLEINGCDWRMRPLHERRQRLHEIIYSLPQDPAQPRVLQLSDIVRAPSWATLAEARDEAKRLGTEGLMLKRRDSAYGVGRTKGDWWKWKVDPYTIDCVLMYAQRGHGKRASLYTDYTFGVWNQSENTNIDGLNQANMPESPRQLVTFAKAYSGLSDEEIREVDAFIRANTLEKFGPVRTVKFALVFELAFEAIQPSTRHKSGFAVRFPRISRMRPDKTIDEADSVETIRAMLGHRTP
jgi:DNA ligase 1